MKEKSRTQKPLKSRIEHYLLFCLSVFLIGVVAGVVNGIIKKREEKTENAVEMAG